ncbi:MAG: lysophospholipid acyltransferase family protein [Synergistaceae bacterium]
MNWKVRQALNFAHTIKPGLWTTLLADVLTSTLKVIAPRKKVALSNMDIVFPKMPKEEKEAMLRESYDNMVWTGLELLSLHKNPDVIKDYVTSVDGEEYLDNAITKGKGIILLSSHIGNWELNAAWCATKMNIAAIARSSDSPFQRELIEELRKAERTEIIDKTAPMTKVISHIRKKGAIGLLSDQHAGNEGIDVPFFGENTGTVKGAGVFAYLTGAPIIPMMTIRVSPFKLKIKIYPEIKWEKGSDRDSTVKDITILCNQALELMIKDNPGQWLWQHRRFREKTGD